MASFSDARPYIDIVCQRFPALAVLFARDCKPLWDKYLHRYEEVLEILGIQNLNFLATTIGAAQEATAASGNGIMTKVLTTLNRYLQEFINLPANKCFTDKLLNPDGLKFLDALSELSLAYRLKMSGYAITFEMPFRQRCKQSNNDVDIKAVSAANKTFYFEVYNPAEAARNGFVDPVSQDSLAFKVKKKLAKKFGLDGLSGLEDGMVFLAVNTAHVDDFRMASILAPQGLALELERFTQWLPAGVDGYIFFDDDFTTDFVFQGLFLADHK